jgi:hypothetical protein
MDRCHQRVDLFFGIIESQGRPWVLSQNPLFGAVAENGVLKNRRLTARKNTVFGFLRQNPS